MEFIRTIREKHQTARQNDIALQAEARIRVADFDNTLFIAFDGTPLVPIEKEWTTKEIVNQLSIMRNNYINSKLRYHVDRS